MKNEETEAASCRSEKIKQLLFISMKGYRISHYLPERINKRTIQFYTVEIALCYLCFFSCFSFSLSFSDLIFLGHIWVSEGLFCSKMHTYFFPNKIRVVSGLREGLTTDETGANSLVN